MTPLNILLGMIGPFQLLILLIFIPILIVIPIVLCVKRAEKLNQSKLLWGVLGFFFGYIAVLIAYILPAENAGNTKQCPYCGEKISTTAKKCKHCGEWLENR